MKKNKTQRLNTLQACTLRTSGRLRWDRLQHAVALWHTDRAELLQSFYNSQACHLLQTKFCLWEEMPVSWNAELTLSTEYSRPFSGSCEHLVYITNTPLTPRDSALPFSLWSQGCSAPPNVSGSSCKVPPGLTFPPLINKPIQQLLILSRQYCHALLWKPSGTVWHQ